MAGDRIHDGRQRQCRRLQGRRSLQTPATLPRSSSCRRWSHQPSPGRVTTRAEFLTQDRVPGSKPQSTARITLLGLDIGFRREVDARLRHTARSGPVTGSSDCPAPARPARIATSASFTEASITPSQPVAPGGAQIVPARHRGSINGQAFELASSTTGRPDISRDGRTIVTSVGYEEDEAPADWSGGGCFWDFNHLWLVRIGSSSLGNKANPKPASQSFDNPSKGLAH